jgi:hypothetical protein
VARTAPGELQEGSNALRAFDTGVLGRVADVNK